MDKIKTPVIYAYKKKSEDKIVYVGQTVDLYTRHKVHVKYDPYNHNNVEYNYPLSRGIRKYGEDEYELLILEKDVPIQDLDERETYYIALYNTYLDGYNQNIGGSHNVNFYKYSEDVMNMVMELLRDEEFSLAEIARISGLSLTHLYNINIGARRRQPNVTYPIRREDSFTKGRRLSDKELLEIHDLLKYTTIPMNEIAKMYNTQNISAINLGRQHRVEGCSYPLRVSGQKAKTIQAIRDALIDSNMTQKEIGELYGVSGAVVNNINRGISYKIEGLEYPLRKTGK